MVFYAWIKRQNLRYDFSCGRLRVASLSLSYYISQLNFLLRSKDFRGKERLFSISLAFRTYVCSKSKTIRAWEVNKTSSPMRFRVRSSANKTNSLPGHAGSLLPVHMQIPCSLSRRVLVLVLRPRRLWEQEALGTRMTRPLERDE